LGIIALGGFVTYFVTNAGGVLAGALAVWLAGELAERYLYFRAVDAAKMPGVASSS
jgi:hypothetical protein